MPVNPRSSPASVRLQTVLPHRFTLPIACVLTLAQAARARPAEAERLNHPKEGVVVVENGQSLSSIARAHRCSIAELARVNKIDTESTLQIGQRLLLPGSRASKAQTAAEKRWGMPKKRGTATLYRLWSGETERVRLVDTRGRTRAAAQRQLREFFRPRDSRKRKLPNARLLGLLAKVSDHYGGRPIHVVSGYRLAGGFTRKTSHHVAGEAIDFRIPGVPLTELRDYCSRFDNVGVGYYPRSQFVHLDVRRDSGRWTDWSLPGQAAILTEPVDRVDLNTGGVASAVSNVEIEKVEAADDEEAPRYDATSAPPEPARTAAVK